MSVPFSLVLDGTDVGTNAIVGTADNLSNFSVSFWTKFSTPSGSQVLMGKFDSGSSTGWFFYFNPGTVFFQIQNPGATGVSYGSGMNDGNWHNVIATLGSSTISLYVDGIFRNSASLPSGSFSASTPIKVSDNFVFNKYIGKLCDVRIYSITLSPSDVSSIFAGNEPQSASRLLEWPPSEGSGTTVSDFTGNGNTLTFNSVAWSTDVPAPLVPPLTLTLTDSISSSDVTTKEDETTVTDSLTATDLLGVGRAQNVSDVMTVTDSFSAQSSFLSPVSTPVVEVLTNQLIPAEVKVYYIIQE